MVGVKLFFSVLSFCFNRDKTMIKSSSHAQHYNVNPHPSQEDTRYHISDKSILIGGLGPVQKVIGQILFFAKIIIELELFSTSKIG